MEPKRRDAIDVARVLALLVVVLGHLLLAVIDRSDGELRGANLVALHPGWAWVTSLAPMPVFFAAGGWANATTTAARGAPRVRALVGLGSVVVVSWSALVLAAAAVTGDLDAGVVGDGARIATQPLWFLAAYVPMALAGAHLAHAAGSRGPALIAAALGVLALLDLARFGLGAPEWIGWPGFFLAWGVPWIAGAWWRGRAEPPGSGRRFEERRTGATLAAVALAGCAALVAWFGYEPALIDAVPDVRSNTTPPTLYTAVAALAQVGLLLMAAGLLDLAGRRWRRALDRAGEAAVGVYAWHLTALALCAAVIAAGLPVPERLTTVWWITRPLWWVSVVAVTAGLVALTAWVRSTGPDPSAGVAPSTARITAGAAVTVAAAGTVGLEGPKTVPLALVCSALFLGAWLFLRDARRRAPGGPH